MPVPSLTLACHTTTTTVIDDDDDDDDDVHNNHDGGGGHHLAGAAAQLSDLEEAVFVGKLGVPASVVAYDMQVAEKYERKAAKKDRKSSGDGPPVKKRVFGASLAQMEAVCFTQDQSL